MDSDKPVEMAALGRPFNLGMLYDCRRDRLIPGLTFWDREKLDQDMRVTPQPNTQFEIVASDSVSQKASSLGVDAALKASFLCGLVKVQGSAKYLNDNKSSRKQARVALQYKSTTVFKELTMNQLSKDNIKHHEVIDQGLATHVVTAILYGAQAFFVFDQETSEEENVQDVQGNLQVIVKKIPLISIDGKGALKMEGKDKEKVNKFSCTFHGDFCLDKSPTTFEEAVKVYQDLPKLLGPEGKNAVPVRVYLLPLSTLDSKASKLVRQISLRLVSKAESFLVLFRELEMRCNDTLKSPAGQNFSHISKKVETFNKRCSHFRQGLETTLATKLPLIRGGGEEEATLAEVLKKTAQSPFNPQRLNQWMDSVVQEANTIKALTNLMKNTQIISSQSALMEKVCGPKKALVFVFTSLESAEPYLEELENLLEGNQTIESRAESKRWYKTKDVIERMKDKAKVFGDFADANKDQDRQTLRFLAVGLADESHEDATIYLYEDGFRASENFELPSKPSTVSVGRATEKSVSLQFSAPSVGAENVSRYRVEFCKKGQEQWNQQLQAEAGGATVTGLIPNTEYSVRVRAVTEAGVGPAAPDISIKTLPCGPPEEPTATSTSTEIYVHWRRPAEVGPGAKIIRYIVEYAPTEDRVQWRRAESDSEEKKISGLQRETEYTLRILCDCGEDGTSSESSTVTITTKTSTAGKRLVKDCLKTNLSVNTEELTDSGLRKHVFGTKSLKEQRVMMLVGPVGSGKTSLINAMVNYILGVKWADSYRFVLCEEQKTSETVVYQINHQEGFQVDFSLTIIDTPGFGANDKDLEIRNQIHDLLRDLKVTNIHAVCLVLPSGSAELSPALRYTLDSSLSLFGKDVAENIRILVTFADLQDPPVLQALTDAEVPCPKTDEGLPVHYKFNNSALLVLSCTSADPTEELFWNMSNTNMKIFLRELEKTEPKGLTQTEEVIKLNLALEKYLCYLPSSESQRLPGVTAGFTRALNRLKEIALKPDPLFTPESIDLLIEEEQREAKPEWSERVGFLRNKKKNAEILDKIKRGEALVDEA